MHNPLEKSLTEETQSKLTSGKSGTVDNYWYLFYIYAVILVMNRTNRLFSKS